MPCCHRCQHSAAAAALGCLLACLTSRSTAPVPTLCSQPSPSPPPAACCLTPPCPAPTPPRSLRSLRLEKSYWLRLEDRWSQASLRAIKRLQERRPDVQIDFQHQALPGGLRTAW